MISDGTGSGKSPFDNLRSWSRRRSLDAYAGERAVPFARPPRACPGVFAGDSRLTRNASRPPARQVTGLRLAKAWRPFLPRAWLSLSARFFWISIHPVSLLGLGHGRRSSRLSGPRRAHARQANQLLEFRGDELRAVAGDDPRLGLGEAFASPLQHDIDRPHCGHPARPRRPSVQTNCSFRRTCSAMISAMTSSNEASLLWDCMISCRSLRVVRS